MTDFSRDFLWRYADLAFLDDVGEENVSVSHLVESFVRDRYDRNRPTIIASNFDEAALVDRYGSTLGSIMREEFTTIDMGDYDWREEAAE